MKTRYRIPLSLSRKMALATLISAWSIDLGHGLFITHNLSLIKITLLFLSATLALSEQKGGAVGCALVTLLMAVIIGGHAASLSQPPFSLQFIISITSLTLFLLTTLFMVISLLKKKERGHRS